MPNIIEKTLARIGWVRSEKAVMPSVSSSGSADPFAIWRGQKKVAPDRAFDVYAGWVYACIRAIAEEIAAMTFVLNQVNSNEEERLYEHEVLDLLGGVNPQMTGIELLYMTAAHLESIGNAYWFLDGVQNETDIPTGIFLLNSSRVRVIVNRDEFPTRIDHYEYRAGNKVYNFQPYQLIHFKYPDPSDPFEGVGTVQSIAQWIDADNYAMEFNRRFFLNGARVGAVLESDAQRTPEQLEYLKKSFENIFKGVENAYKVLALPTGVKYSDMGQTQKDLDFANLMTMMRDRILAGFRVPRTALGITDDVNRANAEATDYVFALRTIKPKMSMIVSYLNEFLLPRFGDNIYLSFEDPVPENRELRMQELQAALASQPALSVNEAREEYFGLPPISNGDEVMGDFSKVPLGKPEGKTLRIPKKKTKGGKGRKTRFARAASLRKDAANTLAEKAAEALTEMAKKFKRAKTRARKHGISKLTDKEYEAIYKAFFTRVTPYEKAVQTAVRTFNAQQKPEVEKVLESKLKDANDVLSALKKLFGNGEWPTALVDLTAPALVDLFQKEGAEAADLVGFTGMDILTPEAERALERSLDLMANKYNDTTLSLLEDRLKEGFNEGLSLDELKGRVAEVYEFSDEHRAEQVARTETFRVANDATKEAWKQTGVVKTIKWYTAADERVCPWCDPMDGKIVDIEESFFDKGDTVTGSDGSKLDLDYAAVDHPPLHVSCRCYIRPEEINIQ